VQLPGRGLWARQACFAAECIRKVESAGSDEVLSNDLSQSSLILWPFEPAARRVDCTNLLNRITQLGDNRG